MLSRRFTSREKRFFVICIFLILTYTGYNNIFLPLKEYKGSLETRIRVKEKLLKKHLRVVAKGKSYREKYNKFIKQFKQVDSDEKIMSMVLSEIEQVAGDVELSITQMKPQRVKKEDFFNHFSVSLSFNAPLSKVTEFLYNLQGNEHFFSVDEIRLDKFSPRHADLRCKLVVSKILVP